MQALRARMSDVAVTGKAKGGVARAKRLSPEERSRIAKRAAAARWTEGLPQAVCGSPDRPLRIASAELPCYVLADGTRVLSQGGFLEALGRHRKANVKRRGEESVEERVPPILQGNALRPFISAEVLEKSRPIAFRTPSGVRANGYRADLLPHVCEVYLKAREENVLPPNQMHIAKQAEILVRGLANVGIIALVDEATGYQELRARDALARILEQFIAKELQAWVQTFPSDFYQELFRLRGLDYPCDTVKRPQYFGILTNDIVYKRLAPGVLDELKRVTLRTETGRPKHKYFQHLTQNIGYPKLREHLGSAVTMMKLSDNWGDFMSKLNRIHPKYGATLPLPLTYNQDEDEGTGL
jgi:P63C domain